MTKKAVVLLSGGLDSATALYWAKSKGYSCHCLIFDYGQRHKREVQSARKIARKAGCGFDVIALRLAWKNGCALVDRTKKLPDVPLEKIGTGPVPSTYVAGRNTIFIAYGISAADALGAEAVVLGANAVDFSGYPDCRPDFCKAFQEVAELGTRRGLEKKPLKIMAPLIHRTKADIVRLGSKLKVPWRLTWSCYEGGKRPCGKCDSCKLRAKGFRQAHVADPLVPTGNCK